MATDTTTIHVFLASPGDVGEERAFVRQYLESVLPQSALVAHRLVFDVVASDHPASSTPMPAHLSPQEAVIRFKRRPADCDIVIVILWGRLGTHLDPVALSRPDGSRYLSGTEWEYENAFNATRRPDILVYRRSDPVLINARDPAPARAEKQEQADRVEEFVARFKNADGSWKGGYSEYGGLGGFAKVLANDLEHLVAERLKAASVTPLDLASRPTEPSVASVPLPDLCLGRDADTETIVAALTATPRAAVLVQGPGGIGKTTLTQQASHHDAVVARFNQRRWFVELETATDRDTFDAALLLALGLDPTQGFDAALIRLAQGLAGTPSLLVLDNLETPWAGDPPAIEQRLARLAALPSLALLASFRGDEVVRGAPWSLRHTVHPLPEPDARALFLRIAPRIPAGDPHLPKLLAELGGVPLAICLTARRAERHDNLAELWSEWQAAGSAFAHLPGVAAGRLTSVPHSIEFSLRSSRLGEPGRRLFRLLGQLPAGIADADRRALLGDDAFVACEQLLGVGLAFMRAGRVDALPPVRDYARRAHPPAGADADWYLHYLNLAKSRGGRVGYADGDDAIPRIAPELPNIDSAIDAAIARSNFGPAADAAYGLSKVMRFSGLGSQRALAALADTCIAGDDAAGAAACLEGLGDIALARSDHATARARYEAALPLYQRVGAVLGEANCIKRLGDIALRRSDHETARARYEAALPLYQRVGAVLGEANCIKSLGDIALRRSDHETARARYEAALPLYQRVGAVLGEANCIQSLGDVALARSDHAAARARYEEALPLYRRVGAVLGEANCIKSLGDIALARSDHAAARARYEEALPLYRRVGDVLGEANCIRSLGNVAEATLQLDVAQSWYEEALPLFRRVGSVDAEANGLIDLGDIANMRKDLDKARGHFNAALVLYERVHRLDGVASAHERLAGVTSGADRDAHVRAAKDTWLAIDLPERAARIEARFR